MSTKIEVNYYFVIFFLNFLWLLKSWLFNVQPKDFLKKFCHLLLNIKCSILHFEMYVNSLNVECNFICLFVLCGHLLGKG